MEPMPPMSWTKLAGALKGKLDETLDQVADLLKDSMLDAEPAARRKPDEPMPEHLPPLDEEAFLQALEPRLEETFWRVTEAINAVRAGDNLERTREVVADLFAALAWEAFNAGIRQRIEAGVAEECPPFEPDRDSWAARYRRMKLLEAAFPLTPAGDEDN
jgi:hypothetical protein